MFSAIESEKSNAFDKVREKGAYQILYQFWFDQRSKKEFKIIINSEKLIMAPPLLENKPSWTQLRYNQCPCCPLDCEKQPFCPNAINIANIIETFKDKISYEKCLVRCITPERTYQKKTTLMVGLSSLMGLVMATSGCPMMSLFKPMARFHLPFATVEETIVRATSMYLLGEYFAFRRNQRPDLELKKLFDHYETIKLLNAGLLARIKDASSKDSDKNALVTLHSISDMLSMEINTSLQSIEYLFNDDSIGESKEATS